MRRPRLKDLIRMPERVSAFSSFLSAVIVLLAFAAVWKTLDEQGLLDFGGAPRRRVVPQSARLTLTATGDHRFYWDGRGPFPIEEATPRLGAWLKTTAKPEVQIAGDANALLSDTLRLFNETRQLGVQNCTVDSVVRARP